MDLEQRRVSTSTICVRLLWSVWGQRDELPVSELHLLLYESAGDIQSYSLVL